MSTFQNNCRVCNQETEQFYTNELIFDVLPREEAIPSELECLFIKLTTNCLNCKLSNQNISQSCATCDKNPHQEYSGNIVFSYGFSYCIECINNFEEWYLQGVNLSVIEIEMILKYQRDGALPSGNIPSFLSLWVKYRKDLKRDEKSVIWC